jgi:3'-phosphoadenosine 5'-phosphosulfate sulfotransferase (PAPS reductase)/FAD synthetase
MSGPYFITGPALISFSGGRTSGYMLKMILDAHGGTLPDDVHVTFANTGKEREETLRFVHDCAVHWNVPVRWLEWRARKGDHAERFEEVGFNSASRAGEPFAKLIEAKSYLPNSVMRFCTDELKIKVMRDFMRSKGYDHWVNVVGLRHDEKHRVDKARARSAEGRERWRTVLPLDDAKVSNRMVRAFWAEQPFDLGLLPFEGNCDGCFLKARPKLYEIERTKPGTLAWWADQEVRAKATFVTEYGYAELIDSVRRQPDLFAGGLFVDDPEMDAECGLWCGEAA